MSTSLLRLTVITVLCLALPAGQARAEFLKVRVSVKVILDAQGNPPPSGYFYLDWQIDDCIRSANEILARNNADWRLDLVELVNVSGISQWFGPISCGPAGEGIKNAAIANPALYRWRADAINMYVLDATDCAGSCARVPGDVRPTVKIINNSTRDPNPFTPEETFYARGDIFVHEIGHFFDLCHTHGCDVNRYCGSVPHDDQVEDTIADVDCWDQDQIARFNFENDYAELTPDEAARVDAVFFNVMGYHDLDRYHALTGLLTPGQLARAAVFMDPEVGPRASVVYRDCNDNGIPDDDEAAACGDCNRNLIPDADDVLTGIAPDCNRNGIPDACDLRGRPPELQEPREFLTGDPPSALVAADLDGDGFLDLATASRLHDSASILWGHGDGTFAQAVKHEGIGDEPWSVAAADFDLDGLTDLAIANRASMDLSILAGAADRNLAPMAPIPLGFRLSIGSGLLAGDFNRDGWPDLALIDEDYRQVAVLLAERGGAFSTATYTAGTTPRSLTAVDLEGDGDLDLLAVDPTSQAVTVLRNAGAGTFGEAESIPLGFAAFHLAAADLDGEGHQDLALLRQGAQSASVLLWNSAAGRFGEAREYAASNGDPPVQLLAGDFNLDGYADLVTRFSTSSAISVLRNLGDGTFRAVFLSGALLVAQAAGDFDGNGSLDLAGATAGQTVSIRLNSTAPPRSSDCNRNGVPDGCDIEGGLSRDEDADHIPDECETSLEASVDRIDFGTVRVGDSATASFDVENTGGGEVEVTGISIGAPLGPNPDLRLVPEFQPRTLSPGEVASYSVTYTPSTPESDREALTVVSDARTGSRLVVLLEGAGLADTRPRFHRGDPNASGATDISDGVDIFGFLFLGGAVPTCRESSDVNNNGTVDITDGISLLNWLFLGGPEPTAPGPTTAACGLDPDVPGSPGDLGCEAYGHCN